jgi:hypothetical protein
LEFSWDSPLGLRVRMPADAVSWRFRYLSGESAELLAGMIWGDLREAGIEFQYELMPIRTNAAVKEVTVSLSIVPNLHAVFLLRPKLLSPSNL